MLQITFVSFILLTGSTKLILPASGLFVEEDLKHFSCQQAWLGELPQEYKKFMEDCYIDKTVSIECRKNCVATKMSFILDGKIWIYQLLNVLKRLYPGQIGKETVDKMVDVILQCTDYHHKAHGPLIPYLCYREKHMWQCISKSAEQICKNDKRKKELKKRNPNKKPNKPWNDQGALLDKGKDRQPWNTGGELLDKGKDREPWNEGGELLDKGKDREPGNEGGELLDKGKDREPWNNGGELLDKGKDREPGNNGGELLDKGKDREPWNNGGELLDKGKDREPWNNGGELLDKGPWNEGGELLDKGKDREPWNNGGELLDKGKDREPWNEGGELLDKGK